MTKAPTGICEFIGVSEQTSDNESYGGELRGSWRGGKRHLDSSSSDGFDSESRADLVDGP